MGSRTWERDRRSPKHWYNDPKRRREIQRDQSSRRTRGSQTPQTDLYLPPSVTTQTLLRAKANSVNDSARAIAIQLSSSQPTSFSSAQISLLEAIVYLMTESQRDMASMAVRCLQQIQQNCNLETEEGAYRAHGIAENLRRRIDDMMNRPVLREAPTIHTTTQLPTENSEVVMLSDDD